MGLLSTILASSAGGAFALLVVLGLTALNYWATLRIITQAGFSPKWILLPLAPLVLTIICEIIFLHDVRESLLGGSLGYANLHTVGALWYVDLLLIFLNWVFYLVFAFTTWPNVGTSYSREPSGPPPTAPRTSPGPSPSPVTGPGAAPAARAVPASAASPGAGPAAPAGPTGVSSVPVAKRPSAQACAWCGEALPGNRALFHDCGPKDRPETHCKDCGTAFPAGTTTCVSCGTE
jgi:hypothetical protein